jgi:hypothetical protein
VLVVEEKWLEKVNNSIWQGPSSSAERKIWPAATNS